MNVSQSSVAVSNYYLFKTDDKGNIVFVDPALLEQVAKSEGEVRGKYCDRLLPLNDTSFEYETIFEAVQTHQIWEGEVENTYNNQSKTFQMAVTTSHEEDDSYGYIFILTPKEKSNTEKSIIEKSMSASDHHSGRGLLENQLSSVMPVEYKVAFTVALTAVVMFGIKDASLVQASVLIGLVLVVLLPILATGMVLDKWLLKPEKPVLSDTQSLYC